VDAVLRTEPAAGALVKKGTAVLLTVSDGLKVPADLVGRTEQEAVDILTNLGLQASVTKEEGGQVGRVSRTVPPPGTVVKAGDTVQVFVGVAATTTTSSTTTTAPTTTTSTTITTTTTTPPTTTPPTTAAPPTTAGVTTT
jgi:beta-lactam-binding protein with PASTA domain